MMNSHWWQGKRGEWFVVFQLILFLIILYGPRSLPQFPVTKTTLSKISSWIGIVLIFPGMILSLSAIFKLGRNLTPLPYPKESAPLVKNGSYRIVRHPIYSGLIFLAFGWAFFVNGYLTFLYALLLFLFFDRKATLEEKWLSEKYSNYDQYKKTVKRLIPFLY
jgi:protein-S-isoprenylcysteine O-methyltransferase Ste14